MFRDTATAYRATGTGREAREAREGRARATHEAGTRTKVGATRIPTRIRPPTQPPTDTNRQTHTTTNEHTDERRRIRLHEYEHGATHTQGDTLTHTQRLCHTAHDTTQRRHDAPLAHDAGTVFRYEPPTNGDHTTHATHPRSKTNRRIHDAPTHYERPRRRPVTQGERIRTNTHRCDADRYGDTASARQRIPIRIPTSAPIRRTHRRASAQRRAHRRRYDTQTHRPTRSRRTDDARQRIRTDAHAPTRHGERRASEQIRRANAVTHTAHRRHTQANARTQAGRRTVNRHGDPPTQAHTTSAQTSAPVGDP